MSGKRQRQPSLPSHEPPETISHGSHIDASTTDSKLQRASHSTTTRSLVCSLPPSCAPPRHPTTLGSLRELEAHYARYHTHICQEGDCRRESGGAKMFPDARMLALVSDRAVGFYNTNTYLLTASNRIPRRDSLTQERAR